LKAAAALLLVLLVGGLFIPVVPAQAAEEPQPPGLKGAVYSASASGPDGSRIYVSVLWDDMPTLFGLPLHNSDRTFYPGDALRVRIAGSHSGGYEDAVVISGAAEPKTVAAGGSFGSFDLKEDLQVRTEAGPGLQDINFALFPRNGIIDLTIVDENGSIFSPRRVYANGTFLGSGAGSYSLEQGEYTLSFELSPENVLAPPSVEVTLTPARRLNIIAYYRYAADNDQPRTDVSVLEQGAATFLPTLTATLRIYVVPYNPKFVVIPYLCTGASAESSYEMPFAILVRYDGNQYDPENENRLSLDQRMLLNGVSIEGHASWPLRSLGAQQRYHDNGEPSFLENGDPEMYEDFEELRYDNGMSKLEIATVSVASDMTVAPGGFFNLSARYSYPVNLKEQCYTHRDAYGSGPFGWLNFNDAQLTGESANVGGKNVFEFLAPDGKPLVFDGEHRYHKFVFTIRNEALSWVEAGEGTLSLDVSFWTIASRRLAIKTGIEWSPLILRQPVQVTAWRLAPWAREAAEENAQVLYLDNAWMVDYRANFDVSFASVIDAENFLSLARDYARVAAPFMEEFFGASQENLKAALENALKFLPPELRGLVTRVDLQGLLPAARTSLYSIANLDNYMIGVIVKDTGLDKREIQHVTGAGKENAEIERRGLTFFIVEGRAWFAGENAKSRQEMVELPFDNRTAYCFDINLSGEGMVAEVISDTPSSLELRIHAPPRSGGLRSVRILDNEGNLLYQREFSSSLAPLMSLGSVFGVSAAVSSETAKTLTFDKTPSTPTEIYVELTNAWGASRTQQLTISPWASVSGGEMNIWGWLIAAGIFAAAWAAFVNWLKERKSSQLARGFAS